MTKIIAISNQKGGVGKTTSSINIGAGLANKGFRVVLVDLDPQGNMSSGLGLKKPEFTIHGALLNEYKVKAYPIKERLALIACDNAFSSFEKLKGDEMDREYLLRDLLEPLKSKCDFIILDCPPSLGLITVNAFTAANEVLIPLEAQLFSTDGLEKVVEMVQKITKRLNPDLVIKGIFFTRYSKRTILKRDTLEEIKSAYPQLVYDNYIRESIALGEAPHVGKDIFSYAIESAGSHDYNQLIEEYLFKSEVTLSNI
ncbi:MAG: ParA family protein [Bacteroidota bacterium]|nr:ParA family protein [Bacteroidota bacterium]